MEIGLGSQLISLTLLPLTIILRQAVIAQMIGHLSAKQTQYVLTNNFKKFRTIVPSSLRTSYKMRNLYR